MRRVRLSLKNAGYAEKNLCAIRVLKGKISSKARGPHAIQNVCAGRGHFNVDIIGPLAKELKQYMASRAHDSFIMY